MKLFSVKSLKANPLFSDLISVTCQFNDVELQKYSLNRNVTYIIEFYHLNGTCSIYANHSSMLSPHLKNNMVNSLIDYFTKTNMLDYLAIILNYWE